MTAENRRHSLNSHSDDSHSDDSQGSTRWLSSEEQAAWRCFLTGSTQLFEHLDRELRECHGLSLPEYEILVRLSEAPGRHLRMAELADSVSHSRSRVTHTIARLERAGLVERQACASDGRGVNAHLTERGWQALTEAAPRHVASVREALVDQVNPADLAALGRIFNAVTEATAARAGGPDASAAPDADRRLTG